MKINTGQKNNCVIKLKLSNSNIFSTWTDFILPEQLILFQCLMNSQVMYICSKSRSVIDIIANYSRAPKQTNMIVRGFILNFLIFQISDKTTHHIWNSYRNALFLFFMHHEKKTNFLFNRLSILTESLYDNRIRK